MHFKFIKYIKGSFMRMTLISVCFMHLCVPLSAHDVKSDVPENENVQKADVLVDEKQKQKVDHQLLIDDKRAELQLAYIRSLTRWQSIQSATQLFHFFITFWILVTLLQTNDYLKNIYKLLNH